MKERHEISFEEFQPSEDQVKLTGKTKERAAQAIAKLREELGYRSEWIEESISQSSMPKPPVLKFAQEKADWLLKNGQALNERLRQLCSALRIPEHYDSGLRMFFLTGHDFYLLSAHTAPFDFAVRADFTDDPLPLVHEIYRWLPQEERNNPKLLVHDLDFLARGNLETFTAEGWRQLGNWITKLKEQFDAGKYYGVVRGRPHGTTTHQADEKALEMYKIYLKVRQTYKGKQRKRRKGRSQWASIYDEVRSVYEATHRLPVGSITISSVKYLVRKGKRIHEDSEAN